jgi:hypothetical protein
MEHQLMSEKNTTGVPFDSEDALEQDLWTALAEMPQETPSPQLRREFYRKLDEESAAPWYERLRNVLGFSGNAGWATASVCLLIGLVLSPLLRDSDSTDQAALVTLELQVATLNRNLILDRLDSASASVRLRGVIDAVGVAEEDPEVARALLARATDDSVFSIRSAAIDALGTQLTTPAVGDELMHLLQNAQSPLVQLALVDLVLRHGSAAQLDQLVQLAEMNRLHADLVQHVLTSTQRDRA